MDFQRTPRRQSTNQELRVLSVFRKDIKCHLSKRLSPQLSTWKSLEDICIETIVAKKADFYQAAIIKGSNPFKKLAPPLRTAMLKKLSNCNSNNFRAACRLLLLLVHQTTTSVHLPRKISYLNRMFWEDFVHLKSVVEQVATEAPNVENLSLGDGHCYNNAYDGVPRYKEPNGMSAFLGVLSQFQKLQVLDAVNLKCSSAHLALIASSCLQLIHLNIFLEDNKIDFHLQGFRAMKQMKKLKHFHFGNTGCINDMELQHVNMCLSQLPTLSTVGRSLKYKFGGKRHLGEFSYVAYDRVWAMDGAKYFHLDSAPLALQEFCAPGRFWHLVDFKLLPQLTRLTILQNKFPRTPVFYPETVLELSVLYNYNEPRNLIKVLKPQLHTLTLYECKLLNFPHPQGILAMCPNLIEFNLCNCSYYDLSAIALSEDMRCCQLKTLIIIDNQGGVFPEGILSLLLQAPLLEQVKICVPEISAVEVQDLVEQVRLGCILQKLSVFYIWGDNTETLKLGVQAFCPNPDTDFNGPSHRWPPVLDEYY